jgi:hypothetical protein
MMSDQLKTEEDEEEGLHGVLKRLRRKLIFARMPGGQMECWFAEMGATNVVLLVFGLAAASAAPGRACEPAHAFATAMHDVR